MLCVPCAAAAALALSICRIYGTLAPLSSPRGSCNATTVTAGGAQCLKSDAGGEQWVAALPGLSMVSEDGDRYTCDADIVAVSFSACCSVLGDWVPAPRCAGNSTPHHIDAQVCWYQPWRKDGGTFTGLLFGRARLDRCDIAGDDRDTWDACVLYVLVAGALGGYIGAFFCRTCRPQAMRGDAGPLLGGERHHDDDEDDAGAVFGVVEPAPDGLSGWYPCGTPQGRHCCVCLDEDLRVVFEPCMHLATCVDCATSVRQCPICRRPIERRLEIDPAKRQSFGVDLGRTPPELASCAGSLLSEHTALPQLPSPPSIEAVPRPSQPQSPPAAPAPPPPAAVVDVPPPPPGVAAPAAGAPPPDDGEAAL